ncbi:MAG: hypothetical protein ACREDR_41590, partial [Blastocatellia bacterium]
MNRILDTLERTALKILDLPFTLIYSATKGIRRHLTRWLIVAIPLYIGLGLLVAWSEPPRGIAANGTDLLLPAAVLTPLLLALPTLIASFAIALWQRALHKPAPAKPTTDQPYPSNLGSARWATEQELDVLTVPASAPVDPGAI